MDLVNFVENLFPDSVLHDETFKASAQALCEQFKILAKLTEKILILPRIEELPSEVLDLLAWQYSVDFYEPLHLTEAEKRNLIRQSIAWHRRKGTVAAVEEICRWAWNDAEVIELNDFLFQVKSKGFKHTQEEFATFRRLINVAKNVRSHLERIIIDYTRDEPLEFFIGIGKLTSGNRQILREKPENRAIQLKIGIAKQIGGLKQLLRPKPENLRGSLFIGFARARQGTIYFDGKPPKTPLIDLNKTLNIAVYFNRIRYGHIRPPKDSTPPIYEDIDDQLPDDFVGAYAWFRFFGITFKRSFKLRNIRPDITEEELQNYADFVVQNSLLENTKGEPIMYAVRATIHEKTGKTIY